MRKGKTVIKIILIIILLYNLLFQMWRNFNPDTNFKFGNIEFIIIEDDLALIKKYNEINVGDIVLTEHNNITRIVREKENKTYVTKGDNNYYYDIEEISEENIKGILSKKIPNIGGMLKILQSKIITIIGLTYLVWEYIKIIKNKKKK